jgi:hypothetical protein
LYGEILIFFPKKKTLWKGYSSFSDFATLWNFTLEKVICNEQEIVIFNIYGYALLEECIHFIKFIDFCLIFIHISFIPNASPMQRTMNIIV